MDIEKWYYASQAQFGSARLWLPTLKLAGPLGWPKRASWYDPCRPRALCASCARSPRQVCRRGVSDRGLLVDGRPLEPRQNALGYLGHSPVHKNQREKHGKEDLHGRRLLTDGWQGVRGGRRCLIGWWWLGGDLQWQGHPLKV
jgi:hypothetical protein